LGCNILGRTGTFIALDCLLDHYKHLFRRAYLSSVIPTVNILHFVKKLRECRPGMVQSKSQYMFISRFLNYCFQQGLFGVDVSIFSLKSGAKGFSPKTVST